MSRDDIAYEKLATSLCEEFHKKQGAGLLANLEKRNLDALEVSREKILISTILTSIIFRSCWICKTVNSYIIHLETETNHIS